MKALLAGSALAALLCGTGLAQSSPASAMTGVWRGDQNGMPAVVMVITDEGGSISGAVLFYLQMRKDVNSPWTLTPGLPEPMIHLAFDGTTLRFEVSHRRAHPPHTLNDPPVRFDLKLIGPDKAELVNETERQPQPPGHPFVVMRAAY